MIRVPSTLSLREIQESFRQVQEILGPLERGNLDLNRRRVTNAGDAVQPADYITKRQFESLFLEKSNLFLKTKAALKEAGIPEDFFVTWMLGGVVKAQTRICNLQSNSADLTITAPLLVGSIMDYIFTLSQAIPPVTALFEWNRTDATQFSAVSHDPAPPVGSQFELNVTSNAAPSTAKWLSPYGKFENDNGGGDWTGDGWLTTSANISASANQDLLVIVDMAQISAGGAADPLSQLGVIIAKSATPTADYYMVGLTSANMRLLKYISSTAYTQAGDPSFSIPAGAGQQNSRIHILLTTGGIMRVSCAGGASGFQSKVFDHIMTVTEGTTIASTDSLKIGFRIRRVIGGGGSVVGFSRLMAFSVPTAWEQFLP